MACRRKRICAVAVGRRFRQFSIADGGVCSLPQVVEPTWMLVDSGSHFSSVISLKLEDHPFRTEKKCIFAFFRSIWRALSRLGGMGRDNSCCGRKYPIISEKVDTKLVIVRLSRPSRNKRRLKSSPMIRETSHIHLLLTEKGNHSHGSPCTRLVAGVRDETKSRSKCVDATNDREN